MAAPKEGQLGSIRVLDKATSGTIEASNSKIINLATPTLSTDAATKGYIDGLPAIQLGPSNTVLIGGASSNSFSANPKITSLTALDGAAAAPTSGSIRLGQATATKNINVLTSGGSVTVDLISYNSADLTNVGNPTVGTLNIDGFSLITNKIAGTTRVSVDGTRANFQFGGSTGNVILRNRVSTASYGAVYLGIASGSETASNYSLMGDAAWTYLNATSQILFQIGPTTRNYLTDTENIFAFGASTGTVIIRDNTSDNTQGAIWLGIPNGSKTSANTIVSGKSGFSKIGNMTGSSYFDGNPSYYRAENHVFRDTSDVEIGTLGVTGWSFKDTRTIGITQTASTTLAGKTLTITAQSSSLINSTGGNLNLSAGDNTNAGGSGSVGGTLNLSSGAGSTATKYGPVYISIGGQWLQKYYIDSVTNETEDKILANTIYTFGKGTIKAKSIQIDSGNSYLYPFTFQAANGATASTASDGGHVYIIGGSGYASTGAYTGNGGYAILDGGAKGSSATSLDGKSILSCGGIWKVITSSYSRGGSDDGQVLLRLPDIMFDDFISNPKISIKDSATPVGSFTISSATSVGNAAAGQALNIYSGNGTTGGTISITPGIGSVGSGHGYVALGRNTNANSVLLVKKDGMYFTYNQPAPTIGVADTSGTSVTEVLSILGQSTTGTVQGGQVRVKSGTSTGNTSGDVLIGSAPQSTGSGYLSLTTGDVTDNSGVTGPIFITSGNSTGTTSTSGAITLTTGTATGTRGKVYLKGLNTSVETELKVYVAGSESTNYSILQNNKINFYADSDTEIKSVATMSATRHLTISSNFSATTGINAGNLNLYAGNASVGNADGGNINVSAGIKSGSGQDGNIYISTAGTLRYGILATGETLIYSTASTISPKSTLQMFNKSGVLQIIRDSTTNYYVSLTAETI
jgi:hypothetical protein